MKTNRDAAFWRNAALIAVLHLAAVAALVRWSGAPRIAQRANVLWMDGGTAMQLAATTALPQPPVAEPSAHPDADDDDDSDVDDAPSPSTLRSEIALPTPTSTPRPSPANTVASPPKPAAKSTAKPSAKRSAKKVLFAKTSATRARPKPSATPPAERESSPPSSAESSALPTAAPEVMNAITTAANTGTAPTAGISDGGAGGSGGHGVGSGGASQFGWYARMLHDRFFSQWSQPTSVVRSGVKMSTLVKLRIEKDGRVSRFTILKPSGNVVVDESVAAVAKRVTQVDPLPSGLGDAGYYEVNINFELNSDS